LPVYALSFFKGISGIVSSIESSLKKKKLGGSVDHKKITWIVGKLFAKVRRLVI